MTIIITPRPPLNLFEAVRVNITSTPTIVYTVPMYRIPANGPDPQRDVSAAAVITGLMIANTSALSMTVAVRIGRLVAGGPNVEFQLVSNLLIPQNDYVSLTIDRQVLKTDEYIVAQCATATTATVHMSFILNQREEYTEL